MTTTAPTPASEDTRLTSVELDDDTVQLVRSAATIFGVDEATLLTRAVKSYAASVAKAAAATVEVADELPIQALYLGELVRASFFPGTGAVRIIDGPLAGQQFTAPSTAATAVVALNPMRMDPTTNGWDFWRLVGTGERLRVLRR